ncbi:MAG: lytic murein transglycosylase [Methylococcales bacterium]
MTTPAYKHLLPITLVTLMTGCASNPVDYHGDYPNNNINQHAVIVQPQKPVQPLIQAPIVNNYSVNLAGDYVNNPEVQTFIQHMVQTHGFSQDYLVGLFSQAQRLDFVIRLESPEPYKGPVTRPKLGSWTKYRSQFLTEAHINNGVEFWRNNAAAIAKASATYGVDPEYIVGIIGVETFFGKNFGKTCIFDALTTLAFDTHRRAPYFTQELENFLLMAKEEGYDPRQPKGSWAGAMGYGQFMPSSFRKLAVDFDNNGRRDLWQPADAVGSVAHYFSEHGWQLNGVVTRPTQAEDSPDVIELGAATGSEYWRIYDNFKVIKKYNSSNKYAMAVHQLAQAIKQRYN